MDPLIKDSAMLSPASSCTAEAGLVHVHIASAISSWKLVMQSGVSIPCMVGISLSRLLRDEFKILPEHLASVDALLLDGMPVDEPEHCIVPDGGRIALASGLPGIAGLAMKKGSAVRGLRSGITHLRQAPPDPRPGRVVLALYSLTLPLLAEHFLRRGVHLGREQFLRYARLVPHFECLLEDEPIHAEHLREKIAALPASSLVAMTAYTMS